MRGRAVAIGVSLAFASLAASAAAAGARGTVVRFTVSPAKLPPSGGAVHLTAYVRHARSCHFSADPSVKGLPVSKPCASGTASITLRLPANHRSHRHGYVFLLDAGGAHDTATVQVRTKTVPRIAPVITSQPASATVAAGATATFTAAASGSPVPAVQWEQSVNGGATWSGIGGATSRTYSFPAAASENGYDYRAVFANSAGTVSSAPATLSVEVAPSITSATQSGSVVGGTVVTLSASASGNPAPTVQWQSSADGGATWTSVAGATSATYAFTAAAWQSGWQFRAVFANAVGSVSTTPMILTVLPAGNPGWSGYVDIGPTFTMVTGSWTVPAIDCTQTPNSSAAIWVGIDGASGTGGSGSTVEQDGTSADCALGTPDYFAWYEMYGDASVNNGDSVTLPHPIAAGDSMTGTVSLSGSTWTLTVTDNTAGWSVPTQVANPTPAPAQSSAEWIIERSTPTPLTDFGTVAFSGASVTGNAQTGPISAFPSIQTELTGSVPVLASVTTLGPTGGTFSETWAAAS